MTDIIGEDILQNVQTSICKQHNVGVRLFDPQKQPVTPVCTQFSALDQVKSTDIAHLDDFFNISHIDTATLAAGQPVYKSFLNELFIKVIVPVFVSNELVAIASMLAVTKPIDSTHDREVFYCLESARQEPDGFTGLLDHDLPQPNSTLRFAVDELVKMLTLLLEGAVQRLAINERQFGLGPAEPTAVRSLVFTTPQGIILDSETDSAELLGFENSGQLVGVNLFLDLMVDRDKARRLETHLKDAGESYKEPLQLRLADGRQRAFEAEFKGQTEHENLLGFEVALSPLSDSAESSEAAKDRSALGLIHDRMRQDEDEEQLETLWMDEELDLPDIPPAAAEPGIENVEKGSPFQFSFQSVGAILDTIPLPFFLLDGSNKICWWNAAIEKYLGILGMTMLDQSPDQLVLDNSLQTWQQELQTLRQTAAPEPRTFSIQLINAKTHILSCRVTLVKTEIMGIEYISAVLQDEKDKNRKPILERPLSLNREKIIQEMEPVFSRLHQLIRTQSQILQSTLSLWRSHDFLSKREQETLQNTQNAADRFQYFEKQLAFYLGQQCPSLESIQPNPLLSNISKRLEELVPSTISISTSLDKNVASVQADREQLTHAITLLCKNAVDAMPDGGELTLATESRSDDEQHRVAIIVADTGTGIPDAMKTQLFYPLTTSHAEDIGKGMGLAAVYGIVVKNHNGNISYQTNENGTTFSLIFEASSEQKEDMQHSAGGILIIDDEESVAEATAAALRYNDYTVHIGNDIDSGMEILQQHNDDIDLVILDYNLRGATGIDFAQEMLKTRNIPIIFYSGEKDYELQRFIRETNNYWIGKPFKMQQIVELIRKAMKPRS